MRRSYSCAFALKTVLPFGLLFAACVNEAPTPLTLTDAGVADAESLPDANVGDAGTDGNVPSQLTTPEVSTGDTHACALSATGDVYCWGSNGFGQAGSPPDPNGSCGSDNFCASPQKVAGLPKIRHLGHLGVSTSCAIDFDGGVWCWGKNDNRQLGFDTTNTCTAKTATVPCQTTPKRVEGLPPMADVTLGGAGDGNYHTCALTTEGGVWCWGANASGQDARPPSTTPLSPTLALPPLTNAASQVALPRFAMGVAVRANKAYTWGKDQFGSLGRTHGVTAGCSTNCDPTPAAVRLGPDGATDLGGIVEARLGDAMAMARASDGKLYVWGSGEAGFLLDGDGRAPAGSSCSTTHCFDSARLVADAPHADALDMRAQVACLRSGQDVYCWGRNGLGQVGIGSIESRDCASGTGPCVGKATKVALPGAARQVSVASRYVLVLLADGSVVGWGESENGQLGRMPGGTDVVASDTHVALTPQRVGSLPDLNAPR